jgi:hypothetical protein
MTRDHDRSLDRMLRRAAHPARAAPDECPDAETLAAFADRGLAAAARGTLERHIAECGRCQALTAAMVRTDRSGSVAAQPEVRAAWWRSERMIRWLAPAAAAAFAVSLWVFVPGQRTPQPDRAAEQKADATASQPLDKTAAPPAAAAPIGETRSPAEKREDGRARQDSVQAAPPPAPAAGPAPAAAETSAMRAAAAFAGRAGVDIASPDPQRRWRILPGGIVERSTDAGATWTRQDTPPVTELTAGSAPEPGVCWVVGRAGAILRTNDGGATWEPIPFPEPIDLTAVSAPTALSASVTLSDGRRFGTDDGGRTWRTVP